MIDIIPPTSQVSMKTDSEDELFATFPGSLKMPDPMTIPMIIETTSKNPSVCFNWGWLVELLIAKCEPPVRGDVCVPRNPSLLSGAWQADFSG